jgi:hypothetical protein
MILSCTSLGYLNVHTDSTAATGSLSQNLLFLGSNAINLGSGAISTGTQRITIATNDSNVVKMVNALEIMDDWDSANTAKITIASQSLTAVKISKDANANATGNRIFVAGNIDQLNGNTIDLASGAISTGTQRVTIATDDSNIVAIKNAVEIIDDGYLADAGTIGKGVLIQGAGSGADAGKVKNLLTGEGTLGSGVLRVNLATDDDAVTSLGTIDDAYLADAGTIGKGVLIQGAGSGADAGKVKNLLTGEGTLGSGVLRVNLATDDDAVASLGILDNFVGTDGSAAPSGVAAVAGVDPTTGEAEALKTDSDGVLYNQPAVWSPEVDSTNGWARVQTYSRYNNYSVSPQTSSATTSETTALSWTNMLGYSYAEIWVDVSGANALTNVYIYASPDGTDANQQDITAYQDTVEDDSQTCASGSCKLVIRMDNPPTWIKVSTKSAGTSTVDCYYRYRI